MSRQVPAPPACLAAHERARCRAAAPPVDSCPFFPRPRKIGRKPPAHIHTPTRARPHSPVPSAEPCLARRSRTTTKRPSMSRSLVVLPLRVGPGGECGVEARPRLARQRQMLWLLLLGQGQGGPPLHALPSSPPSLHSQGGQRAARHTEGRRRRFRQGWAGGGRDGTPRGCRTGCRPSVACHSGTLPCLPVTEDVFVAVYDPPQARLPLALNGLAVTVLGTHPPHLHSRRLATPAPNSSFNLSLKILQKLLKRHNEIHVPVAGKKRASMPAA